MTRPLHTAMLFAPAALLLGGFFVLPIGGFLAQGVLDDTGNITLVHAARMWDAGIYVQVMGASVRVAFWVSLASVVLGYPVAYVLATARRGRAWWALLVLLPFWSSFLVRTFAWIVILGRQGPVNAVLVGAGVADRPMELLYSWMAVVLGMTNVLVPFAILTTAGVIERIDRSLAAAAGTLGARPVQAFFRVTLPLSMPGVTAAALLVFVTALGFFIAPALLGSARETMITQLVIQQVLDLVNWPTAAVICLLLLGTALLIFIVFDRLVGLSTLAGAERRGGGGRLVRLVAARGAALSGRIGDALAALADALRIPAPRTPGITAWARVPAAIVVLFLLAPLVLLMPVSFTGRAFLSWPPTDLGVRWYAEVLSSPLWLGAAIRSFVVAGLTATVCFLVAVPAAFAFVRIQGRGAGAAFAVMISPLLVPRLVIAVSLFYLYAKLGLVGTIAGLVLGHAVIALPFFFIAVIAVLKTYDTRLDLAAASLGAPPWQTARRVTLPLIGGGLASAALFAFVVSLDELNVALFASGGLQSTLPKLMWDEATLRFSPLLAAVSTLVLLVMSAVVLLAARLNPPRPVQR